MNLRDFVAKLICVFAGHDYPKWERGQPAWLVCRTCGKKKDYRG